MAELFKYELLAPVARYVKLPETVAAGLKSNRFETDNHAKASHAHYQVVNLQLAEIPLL